MDLDKKLDQYEKTVVEVANEMKNDDLRSEASKEVITGFPNVRLASEKAEVKGGKGSNFLSTILPITIFTVSSFVSGYFLGGAVDVKQNSKITINEIIQNQLKTENSFIFEGDLELFADLYYQRIFNEKPKSVIAKEIKDYFKNNYLIEENGVEKIVFRKGDVK